MAMAAPSRPDTVQAVDLLGGRARIGAVLAIGVVLCWLSLAITTNTVFGRRTPALAGALGWTGSDATTTQARALVDANASPAALARAEALARLSLGRELLNGRAASTLGSVAALQGARTRADRMFRFAELVTRRDTPTQFWLLETAVERGDIKGALLHYDRAMSVSRQSWNVLIPVLATAVADPAVAHAVAARLNPRPNWWTAFAYRLIESGTAPANSLPIILPALRLNPRNPVDLPFLVDGMEKLVDAGAYDDAWALYRRATGTGRGMRSGLRDGDFEAAMRVPPFGWRLIEGEGLSAVIQPREGAGTGNALYFSAEAGRTADVARQLLLLEPGRYVLSGVEGGSGLEMDRPEMLVTCAGAKAPLARITLPPATPDGRRFATAVSIPTAACSAQWLSVRAHAPLDTTAPDVWVDALSLRRG